MIVVREIYRGGLGERAGLLEGDRILSINGEAINDPIDFQVHSADAELWLEVEREGQVYEVEILREPAEEMGLEFEDIKLRSCNNKCVFCFIHQMPKGMRRSLYFEDDDYRLSFLHGSYVTLTNVKDKDIDRIIEQGLSPQYISVHATEADLRQKMLGRNKPTVDIMERIARLADNGIEMHAQVVVCPQWNDGAHLKRTVHDLAGFYPALRSVALVPVGLTRHRGNLPALQPVTREKAQEYLGQATEWGDRFLQDLGERFVYLADEMFLLNGLAPPPATYYDAFPQIENGIGLVRSFLDRWQDHKGTLLPWSSLGQHVGLVTGRLAEKVLRPLVDEVNRLGTGRVDLLAVDNDFFGHGITVSGLLTGGDILKTLDGGSWDKVYLPPNCINGEGVTLDDLRVEDLTRQSGLSVAVGTYDLVETLLGATEGEADPTAGAGRQLSELGYYVGRKVPR